MPGRHGPPVSAAPTHCNSIPQTPAPPTSRCRSAQTTLVAARRRALTACAGCRPQSRQTPPARPEGGRAGVSEQGGVLTRQWQGGEACSPQSTRVGSGRVSVLAEPLAAVQVQSADLNKPTPRCQQTPALPSRGTSTMRRCRQVTTRCRPQTLPTCRIPISWGRLGIHM